MCYWTFLGSESDKPHIKLAAAKSVLLLSRRWDLHISPEIFRFTVLMAKVCERMKTSFWKHFVLWNLGSCWCLLHLHNISFRRRNNIYLHHLFLFTILLNYQWQVPSTCLGKETIWFLWKWQEKNNSIFWPDDSDGLRKDHYGVTYSRIAVCWMFVWGYLGNF